MATHHGKEGIVKTGANAVAEVTDWEITEDAPTEDLTAMGDAAQKHLAGIPGWNGSLTCNWDETDTTGQRALTIGSSHTLNLYPEGDQSTDTFFTGVATITSIRVGAAVQGKVSASFEFLGNGALDPDSTVV